MVERNPLHLVAIVSEGVDIAVAQFSPVDELDAQFEAALNCRQQFAFVNFEQAVEIEEGRYRRFADADCADHLRFDQRYGHIPARAQFG